MVSYHPKNAGYLLINVFYSSPNTLYLVQHRTRKWTFSIVNMLPDLFRSSHESSDLQKCQDSKLEKI